MTREEMAAELRAAGWQVRAPISQATCAHRNSSSQGWVAADGSSHSSGYCPTCGKHWTHKTPAQPRVFTIADIPRNAGAIV